MTTHTASAVDVGAEFVRAYARGDEEGLRRLTHPQCLYREVNPGGYIEIVGVEPMLEKLRAEIPADGGWEILFVDAAPAGPKARVHASVSFRRDGQALRYDWTEYLVVTDGQVVKRDLACGGALPVDAD